MKVKVVFLGDSGVGKTCIISRFSKNEFIDDRTSTLGGVCTSKIVDLPGSDTVIAYEIWDTAGQELYHSLASMYYQEATVAIVVYDITMRTTFEGLKRWVKELKEKGPENVKLVIAANKSDRIDSEEVEMEEGKKYAEECDAIFAITSAKDGTGIKEMFDSITAKLGLTVTESNRKKSRHSGTLLVASARKTKEEKSNCC